VGFLDVSGVDFDTDWTIPMPRFMQGFGSVKWTLDANYVAKFDITLPSASGNAAPIGFVGFDPGIGGIPRVKANTGLTWTLANWTASWNVKYIRHMTEQCVDAFGVGGGQGPPDGTSALENKTPIKSDTAYGLCSNPKPTFIPQAATTS